MTLHRNLYIHLSRNALFCVPPDDCGHGSANVSQYLKSCIDSAAKHRISLLSLKATLAYGLFSIRPVVVAKQTAQRRRRL
jgi:hypothetical protein